MAEQIFIIEDGTLTKFECDDYAEGVYIPDCVKKISCQSFYQMDDVHYCEYKWYDATEAPYCY